MTNNLSDTSAQLSQGWARASWYLKAHYYRGGRSLCGKHQQPRDAELLAKVPPHDPKAWGSKPPCAKCLKRRSARRFGRIGPKGWKEPALSPALDEGGRLSPFSDREKGTTSTDQAPPGYLASRLKLSTLTIGCPPSGSRKGTKARGSKKARRKGTAGHRRRAVPKSAGKSRRGRKGRKR